MQQTCTQLGLTQGTGKMIDADAEFILLQQGFLVSPAYNYLCKMKAAGYFCSETSLPHLESNELFAAACAITADNRPNAMEAVAKLKGHQAAVACVAASPHAAQVASGGEVGAHSHDPIQAARPCGQGSMHVQH